MSTVPYVMVQNKKDIDLCGKEHNWNTFGELKQFSTYLLDSAKFVPTHAGLICCSQSITIEFFRNSPQYRNANIYNFTSPLPLNTTSLIEYVSFKYNPHVTPISLFVVLIALQYNFSQTLHNTEMPT